MKILIGDCRALLPTLPAGSAQCCVTSPPYFGLRDYGVEGQVGLESTPEAYVAALVAVFAEVRRVLADDGTLWLNLGDSYATGAGSVGSLKAKDLIGIPWRVAFALQADGWYLRSDIVWSKPNPMPESVTDRPTKAHEYVFLFARQERYYYDADAIREPLTSDRAPSRKAHANGVGGRARSGNIARKYDDERGRPADHLGGSVPWEDDGTGRNKRSVWTVPVQPYTGAHFATFPPALVEPCILAGAPRGGVVLDPFAGAGTVGLVADRLGRDAVLIELNPAYATLADHRIFDDAPLFASAAP